VKTSVHKPFMLMEIVGLDDFDIDILSFKKLKNREEEKDKELKV